jgi:muramoyltetrapeptide carboxypeptidase
MTTRSLLSPRPLRPGDTLGVFTPSSPAYLDNPGLFENGIRNLEKLGFRVKLGSLTARRSGQGYRSGTGRERAAEFMELVHDPEVHGLMATIGGNNSSSLIPFLDFGAIRSSRKPIIGYSDVTSLHLAILKRAGLRTFYGPAVMCWFGEWPDGVAESSESFLDAVQRHVSGPRELVPPSRWSNHRRSWLDGAWRNQPREWKSQPGWKTLVPGEVTAPVVAANLNTLMTAAGTPDWPELDGRILLIEEMDAPLAREERSLRQLERIGAFDRIAGLIMSKPEVYDAQGAPFDLDALLMEIVADRPAFPIITRFDCGHTLPMLTIPQEVLLRIEAPELDGRPRITLLEPAVE